MNGLVKNGDNVTVYYVEHNTPFPSEKRIDSNWSNRQCHEKSCHCVSDYWTFGWYEKKNEVENQTDREFGRKYRAYVADFIRYGKTPEALKPYTGENQWLVHDKTSSIVIPHRSENCDMFDEIDMYTEV